MKALRLHAIPYTIWTGTLAGDWLVDGTQMLATPPVPIPYGHHHPYAPYPLWATLGAHPRWCTPMSTLGGSPPMPTLGAHHRWLTLGGSPLCPPSVAHPYGAAS